MFARTVGTCCALAVLAGCNSQVTQSVTTTDSSGSAESFALANYEGGAVIVDLWAVW